MTTKLCVVLLYTSGILGSKESQRPFLDVQIVTIFAFQGFYIMIRFLLPVVLLIPTYSALPFEADQELKRETRQAQANSEANCDFSLSPTVDLCDWSNLNLSAFKWQPSSGQDSYWIGGPNTDQTDGNKNGGYAFFETSQLPNVPEAANTVSAMLLSPTL